MTWATSYLIKQALEPQTDRALLGAILGGPGGFASQYHSAPDDPSPVATGVKGSLMGGLLGTAGSVVPLAVSGGSSGGKVSRLALLLAILGGVGGHYAGGYMMRRTPEEAKAMRTKHD